MGDIVNLRKVRKQTRRREDAERAAANRLAYGRTKTERELEMRRVEKVDRQLDGHKIDSGEV